MTKPGPNRVTRLTALLLAAGFSAGLGRAASVPVVSTNQVSVRVMAANLTDDSRAYEDFAIRIFQGLKPDVVAIQEFNYLGNTTGDLRAFVNTAFGTNYQWYRESDPGYAIPNGIISRWPITAAGSWDDDELSDRGFAWARVDVPGPDDLYVVSVHLKASTGSSNELRRANQAAQIKSLVQSSFPAGSRVVVAGDCNIQGTNEAALATFKSFLVDAPIPTDAVSGGDADTNNGRTERYDYVFPSATLDAHRVPLTLGGVSYGNGLVFDSRKFTAASLVSPVQTNDSGLAQHMAVVKDFRLPYLVTNLVEVPPPVLRLIRTNVLGWVGVSNLTYTVHSATGLPLQWSTAGVARSVSTNFLFTNQQPAAGRRFYRVTAP